MGSNHHRIVFNLLVLLLSIAASQRISNDKRTIENYLAVMRTRMTESADGRVLKSNRDTS